MRFSMMMAPPMSDTVEDFRALGDHAKRIRARFGVPCPRCLGMRPRGCPTKLLPQQRCRVDGYVDPRPELTADDHRNVEDSAKETSP